MRSGRAVLAFEARTSDAGNQGIGIRETGVWVRETAITRIAETAQSPPLEAGLAKEDGFEGQQSTSAWDGKEWLREARNAMRRVTILQSLAAPQALVRRGFSANGRPC